MGNKDVEFGEAYIFPSRKWVYLGVAIYFLIIMLVLVFFQGLANMDRKQLLLVAGIGLFFTLEMFYVFLRVKSDYFYIDPVGIHYSSWMHGKYDIAWGDVEYCEVMTHNILKKYLVVNMTDGFTLNLDAARFFVRNQSTLIKAIAFYSKQTLGKSIEVVPESISHRIFRYAIVMGVLLIIMILGYYVMA